MDKTLSIIEVAKKLNIPEEALECFGRDKAKIDPTSPLLDKKFNGDIVLVTAITPTKAGEGKTTMSIALCDGLSAINEPALLCLREPSIGPVFGNKGGATGGGLARVIPSEEIDLHFTGDMHALTTSINLISAIIDNHIFRGNELGIDPKKVVWTRAIDMNDRALREVIIASKKKHGIARKENFKITVASEMMAIMCLSRDEEDFLNRIRKILVAYTFDNKPIFLSDLKNLTCDYEINEKSLKTKFSSNFRRESSVNSWGTFCQHCAWVAIL